MDELIAHVTQRTGLPPAQARQAAEAVVNFLKGRLPAPIAGQLDAVIGGGTGGAAGGAGGTGGDLGGFAKGLGGMLGGNKP